MSERNKNSAAPTVSADARQFRAGQGKTGTNQGFCQCPAIEFDLSLSGQLKSCPRPVFWANRDGAVAVSQSVSHCVRAYQGLDIAPHYETPAGCGPHPCPYRSHPLHLSHPHYIQAVQQQSETSRRSPKDRRLIRLTASINGCI